MKLIILCSLILISCVQEEKTKAATSSAPDLAQSKSKVDDFSDLEKSDDEACDTKEDLEKKIMEEAKAKPNKVFKLQGGDPGCSTN